MAFKFDPGLKLQGSPSTPTPPPPPPPPAPAPAADSNAVVFAVVGVAALAGGALWLMSRSSTARATTMQLHGRPW